MATATETARARARTSSLSQRHVLSSHVLAPRRGSMTFQERTRRGPVGGPLLFAAQLRGQADPPAGRGVAPFARIRDTPHGRLRVLPAISTVQSPQIAAT